MLELANITKCTGALQRYRTCTFQHRGHGSCGSHDHQNDHDHGAPFFRSSRCTPGGGDHGPGSGRHGHGHSPCPGTSLHLPHGACGAPCPCPCPLRGPCLCLGTSRTFPCEAVRRAEKDNGFFVRFIWKKKQGILVHYTLLLGTIKSTTKTALGNVSKLPTWCTSKY